MTHEFKVGDRVRVKHELKHELKEVGAPCLLQSHVARSGEEFDVSQINSERDRDIAYLDRTGLWFAFDWLEPIDPPKFQPGDEVEVKYSSYVPFQTRIVAMHPNGLDWFVEDSPKEDDAHYLWGAQYLQPIVPFDAAAELAKLPKPCEGRWEDQGGYLYFSSHDVSDLYWTSHTGTTQHRIEQFWRDFDAMAKDAGYTKD